MPVDLYQLDRLKNCNLAIVALDGFITELIADFAVSAEGQTYLESYPSTTECMGNWIEHLLYFSYVYESVTLPNMTVADVEAIATQILMQQMDGFDPTEVDTAIPELTAFWQFMLREYQHPQARQIINFLEELQPQFGQIANDLEDDSIDLSLLEVTALAPMLDEDTQELTLQSDRDFIRTSVSFDNLTISEGVLLSKLKQRELNTSLKEIATELVSEFSQEVPSALELELLLSNIA